MTAAAADTQDIYVEKAQPVESAPGARRRPLGGPGRREGHDRGQGPCRAVRVRVLVHAARRGHRSRSDRRSSPTRVRWSGFEAGGAAELGALAIDRSQSAAGLPRRAAILEDAVRRIRLRRPGWPHRPATGGAPYRIAPAGAARSRCRGTSAGTSGRGWTALDRTSVATRSRSGVSSSPPNAQPGAFEPHRRTALGPVGAERRGLQAASTRRVWPGTRGQPGARFSARCARTDDADDELRQALLRWDRRMTADSPEAAAYIRWEAALKKARLATRPGVLVGRVRGSRRGDAGAVACHAVANLVRRRRRDAAARPAVVGIARRGAKTSLGKA